MREEVLERDGRRCARCTSTWRLELHHRLRRSQGGGHTPSNLVVLRQTCHMGIHSGVFDAEGWIL